MALAVPVDRVRSVAGMAAGPREVIHTDCAIGHHIHSLSEEARHCMGHNWPEVAASNLGSLAVRIGAVRMVTAGHMDLAGREGRAKRCRCEDRHLPGGKSPDYHLVEGHACFLSFAFEDSKIVVFRCQSK